MQERASLLREELQTVYSWKAGSSDTDAVVRHRSYGATNCFFAVNDRRTCGAYAGGHMETCYDRGADF